MISHPAILANQQPKQSEITADKHVTTYKATIPQGTSEEQTEKVIDRLRSKIGGKAAKPVEIVPTAAAMGGCPAASGCSAAASGGCPAADTDPCATASIESKIQAEKDKNR